MNQEERARTDRITAAVNDLLRGRLPSPIPIDGDDDDEIRQLSEFTNRLIEDFAKLLSATVALSQGDLHQPVRGQLACGDALKGLQASLTHLVWQTKQVAAGDFTQRTDYLGEFSDSFNWMVVQLDDNRSRLEDLVDGRTRELSFLLDATLRTSKTHDLAEILRIFADLHVGDLYPHTQFRLALLDPTGRRAEIKVTSGMREPGVQSETDEVADLDKLPHLVDCIESLEPRRFRVEDDELGDLERAFVFQHRFKSTLLIPLAANGQILGFAQVSEERHAARSDFAPEALNFYGTLSHHLSVAIHNAQLFSKNRELFLDTIAALAAAIDARDPYTHCHSRNVLSYAAAIGGAMDLGGARLENLRIACMLHDIGKIGIKDEILLKPGPLTAEEFEEIEAHPAKAVTIIARIEDLAPVASIIVAHHERFDGTGYPDGLKGEDIPLEARIIAVADTLDAMTTSRVYRRRMSADEAVDEIKRCSGAQFDPHVVNVFLEIAPSLRIVGDANLRSPVAF